MIRSPTARTATAAIAAALASSFAWAAAPAPPAAEPPHSWDNAAAGAQRLFIGEGRVVIHRGERVVLTFDKDLQPTVESVEPFRGDVMSTARTARAGTIVFSLAPDAEAASVLKVENGLAMPVVYGAMLALPFGDSVALHPTSTCAVGAGLVAFERWRNEVVLIGLAPFEARPQGASGCGVLAAPPDDGRPRVGEREL